MQIAVAGATGTAGASTVALARERGHHVVEISRSAGVDLLTGEGLTAALAGVDVVIDASSPSLQDRRGRPRRGLCPGDDAADQSLSQRRRRAPGLPVDQRHP